MKKRVKICNAAIFIGTFSFLSSDDTRGSQTSRRETNNSINNKSRKSSLAPLLTPQRDLRKYYFDDRRYR